MSAGGDVRVAAAGAGELGHAQLAGGEGVASGEESPGGGGRRWRGARSWRGVGTVAPRPFGEGGTVAQRLAGVAPLPGAAEGGAQVDEGAGVVESGGRRSEGVDRALQPREPDGAALDEAHGPFGDADRSDRAEALRQRQLLRRQVHRPGRITEAEESEGGLRAPVDHGRVRLAEHVLATSDLEQVGGPGLHVATGEPEAAATGQQVVVGVALGRSGRRGSGRWASTSAAAAACSSRSTRTTIRLARANS